MTSLSLATVKKNTAAPWTHDEMIQVQLFQKPDSLCGTSNFREWHQPPTGQVRQHQEHAGAKMHERNKTVLRSNWLS